MAKDTTKSEFRCIAVPDPRVLNSDALWLAESSYDQAGNTAGVPADQSGSAMVMKAVGTQTAASALRYRAQVGGFPGHGHPTGRGWPTTGIWQRDGQADWYGWDGPTSINGYEVVQSHVAPGNNDGHTYPSIITLASGNVLMAAGGDDGTAERIHTRLYTASTNTWGSAVLVATDQLGGGSIPGLFPDLVQLSSGRVLLFHLTEDTLEAGEANIATYYSDDEGATWTQQVELALGAAVSGNFDVTYGAFTRLRAAYNAATGEVLLLVWVTKASGTFVDQVFQFASLDLGSSFEFVTLIDGGDDDDQSLTGDIVVHNGVFVVFTENPTATATLGGTHAIRLGSAFDALTAGSVDTAIAPISSSRTVVTTTGENRCCACVDDRGVIWLYSTNTAATVENALCFYSGDGGISWTNAMGGSENTGYGSWFQPGVDATIYPKQMACTWQRGRVIMLANHDSPTTSTDDLTLAALYLGGFSTVTLPYRKSQLSTLQRGRRDPAAQVGWERDYLPYELPQNDGWTALGAGSEVVTAGVLAITAAGVATRRYQITPSGLAAGSSAIQHCIMKCNTGEGTTQAWLDDGTLDYRATIQLTSTAITLYDSAAASSLGTDTHGGGIVEWIIAVTGSSAVAWWRDWTSSEERTWTKLSGTLTDGGAADGASRFAFGSTLGSSSTVDVYHYAHSYGDTAGAGLAGFTNPDDLQGLPLGAGPEAAEYIADGVSLYAVDGPAVPGEDWHIDTRYEYAIDRIFPGTSPSPSIKWRSSTTTAGMAIAWDRSSSTTVNSRAWNGLEVIHLRGVNFRQAQLQRTQNAGSTWTDEVEIINYKSVVFARVGDIVYTGAGTPADGPYFQFNELVGGYFEFPNGDVRKITANSEGNWVVGSTDVHQCSIYLEDTDDGEDTSGTGKIWFPNVTVLISPYNANGFRLQINDDATPVAPPEGYFTIGTMFHGRLMPFGRDYSQQRSITLQPNTTVITARDGTRRTRVNGKSRRAVSISFPAVDVTPFSADGQPDVVIETNVSYALAVAADEPVKLGGVLDYLRGPDRTMLYLPYMPKYSGADGNAQLLEHRNYGTIYGRITSGVTMTQVTGTEEIDEVISIAGITIEEEV